MTVSGDALGDFSLGDKVRVRTGPYAGSRGLVAAIAGETASVRLPSGAVLELGATDLTNYSLAARRAWRAMPKRAGRPRLPAPRKKMISVRLDLDVWRLLAQAAEEGLINSREAAINDYLRRALADLVAHRPAASGASPSSGAGQPDSPPLPAGPKER